MEEEEKVVYLKVFDEVRGDVVFEGKVSTDVQPHELVYLRCFCERALRIFYKKATNEEVKSFKGLQNNTELVAEHGVFKDFSGVLYVGADDGVLRKSKSVPSSECVMMTLWYLSLEESEKAFKCETLEELELCYCQLIQIPNCIGRMKRLKKLISYLRDLKSIPEEIAELSNLEELRIVWCGVESLPKRLKELKMLKSFSLAYLNELQLYSEDLVALSKLKHLTIWSCSNAFTPPFTQLFWEMIKSTTDLRVLDLHWNDHNSDMVVAALEENGSIVDGGEFSESFEHYFKRNKDNRERAMECVVYLLAIRRWRNAMNNVPKEMVKMLAMMLWNTRCDVRAWRKELRRADE